MTDMEKTAELLNKYNIGYHTTIVYDTKNNQPCGYTYWLDKSGHIEFDFNGWLVNIVTY